MNTLLYLLIALFIVISLFAGIMTLTTHLFFKRDGIKFSIILFFKYMVFGRGYHNISPSEVKRKIDSGKDGFSVLDVRSKEAYQKGHVPGALSAPFNDLIVKRSIEPEKDKDIIIICYGGGMSRVVSSILAEMGFTKVYNMEGGMYAWKYEKE
ncbi:MAG: rhodanese-like domain-containing protein [Planctomycetes bacterium]|nr:rhodanese-like domain-containing protein [Planctomycetota bacterium]